MVVILAGATGTWLPEEAMPKPMVGKQHGWQPMDTRREKHPLQNLWATGHAPWEVW